MLPEAKITDDKLLPCPFCGSTIEYWNRRAAIPSEQGEAVLAEVAADRAARSLRPENG